MKNTQNIKLISPVVCSITCLFFALQVQAQTLPNGSTGPGGASAVTMPGAYNGGTKVNYVRSREALAPISNTATFGSATYTEVKQSTQFIDGLGRPLQSVIKQYSPGLKDMVSPVVYDSFGREQYKYLPYISTENNGGFKLNAFGSMAAFMSAQYPGESVFYNAIQYENSPLNRVSKSMSAGNSWAGSNRGVSTTYLVNTANDSVRIWNITYDTLLYNSSDNTTNIPTTNAAYPAGVLNETYTLDENGNAIVEYKDRDGKVILKKVQVAASPSEGHNGWLCTYYVYDDFGLLRFVISPKATEYLAANGWTFSAAVVDELCFRYEYDYRNRMIAKKVPGAGWVYMIYDKRDRLVFTQDANMRSFNQWLYRLYDGMNRNVETGMIINNINPTYFRTVVNSNTGSYNGGTINTEGYFVPVPPAELYITQREAGRRSYQATTQIVIDGEMQTENGAELVAEIVSGTSGSFSNTVTVMDNPIPAGITRIPLTYTYYDDYSATSKTYNTSDNSKLGIGANLYGETLPSSPSNHIRGLPTVSRVRVIENPADLTAGKWMETASFYDDKGRIVQTNADNYKGGRDISTNRYDFLNQVICNYLWHSNPAGSDTVRVRTNMDYDHAGRLLTITKQLNDNDSTKRIITRNSYDALGQLLRKELGQKGMGDTTGLDNQDYSYNIRGWLKGQNWNYGASSGPTTSQVSISNNKWFGMDLSYDWGYGSNQYNGNIAGQRWVSAGDGAEYSFGYGYDAANRLLFADFNRNFSGTWDKSNGNYGIDFSLKMGDGVSAASAYDANGNILALRQMGLKLNSSNVIDKLNYSYGTNSNKLLNVTDSLIADQKLGDFTDNNTSGDDYSYDNNGNLLKDRNKSIGGASTTGIYYNHLNLPDSILVSGKGYIKYVYDAFGNKLEKRVIETTPSIKSTATTYLNGFVYENNSLQFLGHEQGRIRLNHYITLSSPTVYAYDYFIKDHLGNTRVVLTDEQQIDVYPAVTLESGSLATDTFYYKINSANIVANPASLPGTYQNNNGNPPYNPNPNINPTATSANMYKLNGSTGDKTGLNVALKVMTGDQVAIYGKSYWHSNGTSTNNSYTTVVNDLLTMLANSSIVANAGKGATAGTLMGSSVTPSDVSSLLGSEPTENGRPNAYINWILFDEQFRVVNGSSGFDPVNSSSDVLKSHTQGINITKSGYLYVYCSNESNQDVFFDNLQVIHTRGPLLEETHYYPFGLTMAGISSKAAGKLENRYKFNGNKLESGEFSDGAGLEMYDFNARTYDQQIGRFMQIDPEVEDGQESWTPYHFGFNNPPLHNDPDGKNPIWGAYRAIGILAKIVEWSTNQSTVAPVTMTPTFLRDGTSVVKTVMDLQTLKEVATVKSESKSDAQTEPPKGGTYVLKDDEGKVQRTGRTNDLKRREGEHARNEKTKDLEFQVDKKTDDKDAQRGREQQIHEKHAPPLNKIKPISDKNPNKQKYLDAAKELEKPKTNNP